MRVYVSWDLNWLMVDRLVMDLWEGLVVGKYSEFERYRPRNLLGSCEDLRCDADAVMLF